jgi:hypothetical protein
MELLTKVLKELECTDVLRVRQVRRLIYSRFLFQPHYLVDQPTASRGVQIPASLAPPVPGVRCRVA